MLSQAFVCHVLDGFQRSGQRSKGFGGHLICGVKMFCVRLEAVVFEQRILQIYFVRAASGIITDPELAT